MSQSLVERVNIINDVPIMVMDNDKNVLFSIRTQAGKRGYSKMQFLSSANEALDLIGDAEIPFAIIVSDYDIDERELDGVGFLKLLKNDYRFRGVIYSNKLQTISEQQKQWCIDNGVVMMGKTKSHQSLFDLIDSFNQLLDYLPLNPKYSYMKENELLLSLAQELLSELESDIENYYSFGGNSQPMRYGDLVNEIRSMSPLGKEFIGNWFDSIKSSLKYFEEEHENLNKESDE